MMKPRDYKQYALQLLLQKGVILPTEDGRLYLVEENLDSRLRRGGDGSRSAGREPS